MITLLDASRQVAGQGSARQVLLPTLLVLGTRERVGVVAARGSGKSIIARLLCGIDRPDTGHVLRTGRISWPLGFSGALHPDLTIAENITLIARILGEDPQQLVAFCESFAELGQALARPMKTASPAQRAAVGWCISAGVACDTYVADDTIGFGLDLRREMSETFLEDRLTTSGLVFLSSNPQQLARFCDRFFVLLSARLVPCSDPNIGHEALVEYGANPRAAFAGGNDD